MYQQPNLIASQKTSSLFLPKLQQYRASGPIEEYTYDALKPKKKLKKYYYQKRKSLSLGMVLNLILKSVVLFVECTMFGKQEII